jgi:hypothetical protein
MRATTDSGARRRGPAVLLLLALCAITAPALVSARGAAPVTSAVKAETAWASSMVRPGTESWPTQQPHGKPLPYAAPPPATSLRGTELGRSVPARIETAAGGPGRFTRQERAPPL